MQFENAYKLMKKNPKTLNDMMLSVNLLFKIHLAQVRNYSTNNVSTISIYVKNAW